MRAAIVLAGFMLIGTSALAANTQDKRPAARKIVVASADLKQIKSVRAHSAKPSLSRRAKSVDEGDSRLNDYRLERESCCGPQ